ncbi:OmpP1/FadL family transporter [Marinigracilibium pacificum]|uniref:Long-chain fatty acid transport protein n=1 Tax=Marinigracilibium pacificum TaxID=2729599 RepID=A0A848J338_9BACT|nr:outer membrane protein transport protein [Marinigracilibium pacificum]NMM47592.1 hypothetical protein [Marinigracilibium pacificum]
MHIKALLTVLIFFWFLPSRSQTAYSPNILPLGDLEPMMANTGTGGLASTGAVFYNPAALTMLKGTSFSLSGTAYLRYDFSVEPIATINNQNLDFNATGYQSIPTSIIMVKSVKDWKLAFSALIPMDFRYNGQINWQVSTQQETLDLNFIENYKENLFLIGLSGARKINEHWSWGATIYLQVFTFNTISDAKSQIIERPGTLTQLSNRSTVNPFNLVLFAGIHRKGDKVDLGLKLSTPSLYLFGTGDFYEFRYSNDLINAIEIEETNLTKVDTKFNSPAEIRIGAVFKPGEKWKIATDLSYNFKMKYDIYPSGELDDIEELRSSYRLSSGGEYIMNKNISIYAGGSYTPSIKLSEENYKDPDYISIVTGFKLKSENFTSNLGLFYSLGKGEQPKSIGTGQTNLTYRYLGAFLGTNYKF